MDQLWSYRTDEIILQIKHFEYPHYELRYLLGTTSDNNDWKGLIRGEIARPLFDLQYKQLEFYCKKFLERSTQNKDYISPQEANKMKQNLESQIVLLQEENTRLNTKLSSLRSLINT
jgi:hypothetical protein